MSAPDKKDPKSPATTSFAWDEMIDKWAMVDTLLGGTATMREAGRVYLPQHEEESDLNYLERLGVNTLFNMMELTLDSFVGRPFSDPVRLNKDVPEQIVELAKDVDLQGNDITTFCREWFREGVAKGFAHVLIDMPAMDEESQQDRTLADDIEEGRRPYWLLVKPENLIFAASEMVNTPEGTREMLTHVRIREEIVEQNGFAEAVTERIRVLEPGMWELWEKVDKPRKKKPEWKIIDGGATGLDFIPLVTYYADRKTLMLAKPPLEDLAYLNIRHWQSTSDQVNVLTVARFPMLAVAGATDQSGTVMRIGPKQMLGTKDANGRFYYVEHTGKSIEAGEKDLLKLEEQMSSYGAEFLKRKPGNETATGRALDSAEAVSPLQDLTIRFVDSVNNVMKVTAAWLNLDDGGTVTITTDFGPEEVEAADLEALNTARKNRDISREAYIKELMRRGLLTENFDSVKDLKQLLLEVTLLESLQPLIPGTFDPSEEKKSNEEVVDEAAKNKKKNEDEETGPEPNDDNDEE